MSYKIIPTETFKTQVRTLQKKYSHIRRDLKDLNKRLLQKYRLTEKGKAWLDKYIGKGK